MEVETKSVLSNMKTVNIYTSEIRDNIGMVTYLNEYPHK